jgi:hypothetical protein
MSQGLVAVAAERKDSHNNNCLTSSVHLAPKTNNLKLTKSQTIYIICLVIIVIRR